MKKTFFFFIAGAIYFNGYSAALAGEKNKISSGGASTKGQIKFIGMGSPVSGKGKAPLLGLGLPYMGKSGTVRAHTALVAPMAAKTKPSYINSEFVLGETYVFPNPAKGGQIPVFHVEVGVADSVKITVYNVAGEIAHNYTIEGLPSTINDGNGLEYAYEYAWQGHIPSGVYYFTIEAQKGGNKLRKTGKFAVVR